MFQWYMLSLFIFLGTCYGHRDKMALEADLQSALMPQELNPVFVPGKQEDPWKAMAPFRRDRRNSNPDGSTGSDSSNSVGHQIKWYSRIVAVVAFAVAAVVEIVLYVMQMYTLT